MSEDDNAEYEEVDAEIEVDSLRLDWSERAEIDADTILWLVQNDLPSGVEGIDHSRAVSHAPQQEATS
jgi:hypothetical protein